MVKAVTNVWIWSSDPPGKSLKDVLWSLCRSGEKLQEISAERWDSVRWGENTARVDRWTPRDIFNEGDWQLLMATSPPASFTPIMAAEVRQAQFSSEGWCQFSAALQPPNLHLFFFNFPCVHSVTESPFKLHFSPTQNVLPLSLHLIKWPDPRLWTHMQHMITAWINWGTF